MSPRGSSSGWFWVPVIGWVSEQMYADIERNRQISREVDDLIIRELLDDQARCEEMTE